MGILVGMNVYVIRNSKLRLDKSMVSGSILAIASSACASCSSMGFLVISTFGGIGMVATDFLTNNQTPLRIASFGHYILYITGLQRAAIIWAPCPLNIILVLVAA